MPEFNLKLTLNQINDIIRCMEYGPYGLVSSIIADFQKQMQAQTPKPDLPTQEQALAPNP